MTEPTVLGPWAPVPPPPAVTAAADAEVILASARTEADRLTADARDTVRRANAEAARIRDSATAKAAKRSRDIDTWSARVVIAAAVGLTASGEFYLARKTGFTKEVAWLLPVVIDVYVIQAFRRHRDIAPAIGLTIATNVIYHLADAGLFGVRKDGSPEWWLIAIVASIASLILWRMHRMMAPAKTRQKQTPPAPVTPPEPQLATEMATASKPATSTPEPPANTAPAPPARTPRPDATPRPTRQSQRAARKAAKTRRSLDEWVEVAGPVFHAEFARLKRQPTANEFATAIANAGLGAVGTSTAKNIRTEILDRADVPALTN